MVVMKKLAYYFAGSMSQSQEERVTSGQGREGGGGHLVLKFQPSKQVGAVKETEVITRSQLFRHRECQLLKRSCNILPRLSQKCSVIVSVISQCQ